MTETNDMNKRNIEEEVHFVDLGSSRESSQTPWVDQSSRGTSSDLASRQGSSYPECDVPVESIE